MATETIRAGWSFKEGNTSAAYADNFMKFQGATTTLKIINDGDNDLEFMINRQEDSNKVDGIVKAGETLELNDIDQGLSTIAVKGSVATAYRLWGYH
jgi:hypothetical protein